MTRLSLIAALALCAGCSFKGSTTTERPALLYPAIGPEGAFWDALTVAQRADHEALRLVLSPRFIHEAVLPGERRYEVETQQAFDRERARLEAQLKPYENTVKRMIEGYVRYLADLTSQRFVEVARRIDDIKYKDGYSRASGPNRASLIVHIWSKDPTPTPPHAEGEEPGMEPRDAPETKPETLTVHFIQDHRSWLIDNIEPNRLKGAYSR